MDQSKNPQPHVIQEVAPGVYWALLDFPGVEIVSSLVDPEVPHVLCWEVCLGRWQWERFLLPVGDPLSPEPVLARAVDVDFVVDTSRFLELVPKLGPGISAVQLHATPQDHLDLRKIKGPELWRLLGAVGWHVWFRVPGNDYAEVASPHRSVVEAAIHWAVDE